jgi:hypothetical protein
MDECRRLVLGGGREGLAVGSGAAELVAVAGEDESLKS